MTLLLNVFHNDDLYEVVIKDNSIARITKYIGQSQSPRDLTFADLPVQVKRKLIAAYNDRNKPDEL